MLLRCDGLELPTSQMGQYRPRHLREASSVYPVRPESGQTGRRYDLSA